MESAPKPTSSEAPALNQWESLTEQRSIAEQQFQDDLLNIEDMQKSGRISSEQAEQFRAEVTAKVEKARNPELSADVAQWLQDELANVEDMLQHGRIDQAKADKYTAEVKDRAIAKEDEFRRVQAEGTPAKEKTEEERRQELEEQLHQEEEKKKKIEGRIKKIDDELDPQRQLHEEEERRKLEEEEKRKLEEEKKLEPEEQLRQEEEKKRKLEERLREIDEELGPLAAINADFTHDKRELVHDIAEQQLNEDQEKAGLIKRIWKGNLFRKYYQKKYERELLSGERKVGVDDNGEDVILEDIIRDRSGSAIQRFVLGATEDMRYVHEKIGKKRKDGTYDGEKLTEADAKTTEAVRSAVERFAGAKVPEDGSMEDLERKFKNDIERIKAEARDQGREIDATTIDNYLEVAMQARKRVEHGIAMDRVMEGFKVYNAEVRNNIRTEAHRDNIDKIVNRMESSRFGSVVPAEILAMAVGSAWALMQTGARSAAKVAVPVGGIAVSGALSGLRERNRVTEDRARMMRDAAVGLEYDGTSDTEARGHRAKKRAKYEAKIGGTLYDLKPASELTSDINQAIESGDSEKVLRAIAEARVRIDFSDSERKDLISYSSADKMGDERTRLDIAVIRAERSLSDEDKKKLETMKAAVLKDVNKDVNESDKDFRRVRAVQAAKQAAKQAGKTMLIGSAVFFASQELMATLDPNKVGLFEKAGILKTQNNEDAQETILAGFAGPRVRTEVHTDTIRDISDSKEIQQYESAGYTKTETTAAWTETEKGLVDVDPSKSTAQVRVAYDGWANNGTNVSDGNELRLYLNNGQISSGMYGSSTMGGQVLDYDSAAAAGRVKGFLTIGDSKFEIASKVNSAGQLTWGEDGVFTTTTGETIRAVGSNGEKLYKYFEIALDNGKDADGVSHIIPFATDIGADSFSGKIQQTVDTVVEHPAVYDLVKNTITEIPRDVSFGGVFVAPTSRVNLGGPRNGNSGSGESGGSMVIVDTTGDIPPEIITGPEAEEIANNVNGENTETTPVAPENTGDVTPPAPTPNQVPNQPAEQVEGKTAFTERVRGDFGDLVGENGINLMSSNTDEEAEDIARWWNSLSQEAKDAVISFEKEQQPYGASLRSWLQFNGYVDRG